MGRNVRIAVSTMVVVGAIAAVLLLAGGSPKAVGKSFDVGAYNPAAYAHQYVAIEGNLVADGVQWDPKHSELRFQLVGNSGGSPVTVVYHGSKPDNFYQGVIVDAKGSYDPQQNVFKADTLQTKCPSKYQVDTHTMGD